MTAVGHGLILALLGALLALPSSNLQRFDGLPLGSWPEFLALALLVPLVASRAVRRLHRRALQPRRVLRYVLLGGACLGLGAKLALLLSGTHQGFLACYRTPLGPPPAGRCERSWENPFVRFAVTRLDPVIDFGPENLDLSFFNSLRFNFYPWVPGNVRRDRLPLEVVWRGEVERPDPWVARITYVGRATIAVGATTRELPAHYGAPVTARLEVPAGRQAVALSYHFDDGSRTGDPRPAGAYATVRLARERRDGEAVPVVPVRPGRMWRVLAGIADSLATLLVGWLCLFLLRLVLPAWPVVLVGTGVAVLGASGLGPWLVGPGRLHVALGALLAALLVSNRPRTRLAVFFAVVPLSVIMASGVAPGPGTVVYRSAGGDWLTYESHARTILESGSLRAGEDVFYSQPLFRYVRFAERFVLGDGELLLFAASLAALLFGAVWSVARLAGGRRLSPARATWTLAVGLLLLALVSSSTVTMQVFAPLSEHVTWIALLLLFPLLFAGRSATAWSAGAMLAGVAVATRPNQAPGLLLILAVFVATALPRRRGAALLALGLFLGVAALPLAHNLYFGGRWVLFTTTAAVPATLALPPSRLLTVLHDHEARALAWTQVRYLLVLVKTGDSALSLATHGLQLAWLLAVLRGAAAWPRTSASTMALLLVPGAYLAVHLVYNAGNYFPRHVVAAYVAMALVAIHAAGRRARATIAAPGEAAMPSSSPRHAPDRYRVRGDR